MVRKIVVLGTGGTIAGVATHPGDDAAYVAGQLGVDALLHGVSSSLAGDLVLWTEQVAQIDSKDMDETVWRRLLQRCAHWLAQADVTGLVVTHGTDTLEETAYLLQALLPAHKPVVLTGAMRPATSQQADGPGNLRDALQVAAQPQPQARGVRVVFAGAIHDPCRVQKVDGWRIDAFSSGAAGVLGQVDEAGVRWTRAPEAVPPMGMDLMATDRMAARLDALLARPVWPRVELVFSHAAVTGATVDALVSAAVAQQLGAPPVQGLVVVCTGNGTVHEALLSALLRAQGRGVRVVRCLRGGLATDKVAESPFPMSEAVSPQQARLALMLALVDHESRMLGQYGHE